MLLILTVGFAGVASGCAEFGPRVWVDHFEAVELSAVNLTALDAITTNGSIKVLAADDQAESITVRVHVRAGGLNVEDAEACLDTIQVYMPVEQTGDGNVQEIYWDWSGPRKSHWQTQISYEIEMPPHLALKARTTNGEVRARGIGSLCDVESTNGTLRVDGGAGRLHASTTNGRIEVRTAAEEVELYTTNGSVLAELVAEDYVRGEISSTNGKIKVALADSVSTRLNARTRNGRVRAELPLRDVEESRRRRELVGVMGRGGEELGIRTTNGGVGLMLLSDSELDIDFDIDFDIDVEAGQRRDAETEISTEDIDALPVGIPVEEELENVQRLD